MSTNATMTSSSQSPDMMVCSAAKVPKTVKSAETVALYGRVGCGSEGGEGGEGCASRIVTARRDEIARRGEDSENGCGCGCGCDCDKPSAVPSHHASTIRKRNDDINRLVYSSAWLLQDEFM